MADHPATISASLPPRLHHILFLDHTAKMGGGEIALLHLLRCLDRTRFKPAVILFSDGPLKSRLNAEGVEVSLLLAESSLNDARKDELGSGSLLKVRAALAAIDLVRRLYREIRRNRPSIVYTNSLKSAVIGGIAGRLAGCPVVWHIRDRLAADYLPAKVAGLFRRLCQAIPDLVITNSEATRQTIIDGRDGAPFADRVRVAHDGCTVPTVLTSAQTGAPRIGIVGRIASWKGQDVFLRAAAKVRERFPEAHFLVVGAALFGEDGYADQLLSLTEELGLQDVVEFTGFRSDVGEVLQTLTILVHASVTGEPFGQVIIEGMAAGKPVVATRGGGVPEIVVHGSTGLLVRMGDPQEMAEAIISLLSDPAAATVMGEKGRQRVREHFSVMHAARRVEMALDSAFGLS